MATKTEIIAALKAEYPTLKTGNDNDGYVDLDAKEYQAKISEWADVALAEEAALAELAKAETAKAAILAKIGITADEAALLLG